MADPKEPNGIPCTKCGGRTRIKNGIGYCDRCGPQTGQRGGLPKT